MRAANGMVLYAFATPVLSKSKLSPWHDAVEISGAGALDLGEIQLAPSRMLLAAHLLAKRKGMYQVLMANVTVDEEKYGQKMLWLLLALYPHIIPCHPPMSSHVHWPNKIAMSNSLKV